MLHLKKNKFDYEFLFMHVTIIIENWLEISS